VSANSSTGRSGARKNALLIEGDQFSQELLTPLSPGFGDDETVKVLDCGDPDKLGDSPERGPGHK